MIRGDSPAESLRGLVPELNDLDDPLARRRRRHPAHGGKWNRTGLAGGWMSSVGGDAVAVLEVRGEHAVVSGEMGARSWHEGGEAGEAVHRVEHDMSRRVMEGVLESIEGCPRSLTERHSFETEGRAMQRAQAFEGVPFMDLAPRADPRLHHSGGLWRENPRS